MGYIVDSTDEWSVETRQESVTITTDYGVTEIENAHLLDVIGTLLEAADIQFTAEQRKRKFFYDMLRSFLASHEK